jgi:EAL domain-containing protein (putative c-di-GMP-specific phosphodiesterase class I)/CHASE2 domain-containing sensor protein
VPWRKKQKAESSPLKLLLWAAVAALVIGLFDFGLLMEDMLRVGRNRMHETRASGDIVFVKIDDKALRGVGRWPWPRRTHAELIDRLTAAGANRIVFDVVFDSRSNPLDDQSLVAAAERSRRVVFGVRTHTGGATAGLLPQFVGRAQLASITVTYNYQNAAWRIPYAASFGTASIPTMAALLGNRERGTGQFMVDYSIDPESVPSASAGDILQGRIDPRLFAGKDVVIASDSEAIGDRYFIPGWGKLAGANVQILAAETLKGGTPRDLGWIPAALLALGLAALALSRRSPAAQTTILAAGAAILLGAPLLLEINLIYVAVVPGLFALGTVATGVALRRFRQRGLVDSSTGLPNLSALRANRQGRDHALIAARIMNYSEIVAALPSDSEAVLVRQIVSRLSVGAKDRTFYQGDGGIFAWFEESRAGLTHHVDALCSLLRNPVRVGDLSIDVAASFGVDMGSSRSIANRLGSALVAAEEAAHEGLKWKYHNPETLENASWKLSMLSQLDAAIEHGEVWIAFQPKLDLATRRIVGAEALARWTHPEKGPIAASEFVAAAEQHDRIGKLTSFVLEKAIKAAAGIHSRGIDFDIAVNLSGRLLSEKNLARTVANLLDVHGLPPHALILELTETAALAGSGEALEMLGSLREFGVRISIDDYGTGLSTLDYLKKIPASEIKIDQSFIRGMCDNRSDRLMVQSTISLAHSLGRRVVAEGVEQRAVLDTLVEMKCDLAQGFIIGRPMSIDSLTKRLTSGTRRDVA